MATLHSTSAHAPLCCWVAALGALTGIPSPVSAEPAAARSDWREPLVASRVAGGRRVEDDHGHDGHDDHDGRDDQDDQDDQDDDVAGMVRTAPQECHRAAAARLPECAPDQGLTLDAERPTRRFASYTDVVRLVRGSVGVGLALAPFERPGVARLRLDVELVTLLRAPRGLSLAARVGGLVWGRGLDGLTLSVVGRYQPPGQGAFASVGMELGFAHRFQALYIGATLGADVIVWSRASQQPVAPSARLLLGHAFY